MSKMTKDPSLRAEGLNDAASSTNSAKNGISGKSDKYPTPMRAIRLKRYDCSGFNWEDVRECPAADCPLHPFRFGKRPETVERQQRARRPKR
jgi:hypothetical protein